MNQFKNNDKCLIFQFIHEYSNLIANKRTPLGFFFSNLIKNRQENSKIFQFNHEQEYQTYITGDTNQ